MTYEGSPKTSVPGLSRRDFLIVGTIGVAGAVATPGLSGAAQAAGVTSPASSAYPVVDVASLASIAPGAQIAFTYPDPESPAMLLSLPGPAAGGIGPDNRLVAFSILCTHKGCPVNYLPERQMFVCPCHWSSFDPAKSGQMIIGQGSQPLPQIRLRIENGMVQAVGIDGLIYGRHTNIL
jgi:arsenite oxidase small subunit